MKARTESQESNSDVKGIGTDMLESHNLKEIGVDMPESHNAEESGAEPNVEAHKKRAKRNPQARRRAIEEAAADLLISEGTERLTHRLVAAKAQVPLGSTTQYFSGINELRRAGYAVLARRIDEDYQLLLDEIIATEGSVDAMVDCLMAYLRNDDEVRADMALYAASIRDSEIRSMIAGNFERFVEGLKLYMDPEQAMAIAVFIDGIVIQQSVYNKELDETFVIRTIRTLASLDYSDPKQ